MKKRGELNRRFGLGALRARCHNSPLRAVLGAGAAQNHRELLEVADHNPNQVLLVRAPRRKAYLDRWKALPEELFTAYELARPRSTARGSAGEPRAAHGGGGSSGSDAAGQRFLARSTDAAGAD